MQKHGRPMTIVLADDDPVGREALEEAGAPVDLRTVADGTGLLECFRREGRSAGGESEIVRTDETDKHRFRLVETAAGR